MQTQLIDITEHPIVGPSVSALALYPLVTDRMITDANASRNVFFRWFKDSEKRFNLSEGKDFVIDSVAFPGARPGRKQIEFILSLPTAILLAEKATARRGASALRHLEEYNELTIGKLV